MNTRARRTGRRLRKNRAVDRARRKAVSGDGWRLPTGESLAEYALSNGLIAPPPVPAPPARS
ncbi:MAG: hypothetical protein ABSD27_13405 [Bryobacteraceae bacterium]|jgi:hypothetical protein